MSPSILTSVPQLVQNGSRSSAHARVQVAGKPAEQSAAPVLPSQQTLAMLLNWSLGATTAVVKTDATDKGVVATGMVGT
jgi:hypothetical protein